MDFEFVWWLNRRVVPGCSKRLFVMDIVLRSWMIIETCTRKNMTESQYCMMCMSRAKDPKKVLLVGQIPRSRLKAMGFPGG